MASYRDKLPASGGGQAPSFQRGVYNWETSTATSVTIPITKVDPSKSFITHLGVSTANPVNWDAVTTTAKLNAAGDGIEITRAGSVSTRLDISWEVCTDQSVSVQRGIQMFSSNSEFTITIPTISDLSKASARFVGLPQVSNENTNSTPGAMMVRCELSANSIKLQRDADNIPIQVSWEVIRYV